MAFKSIGAGTLLAPTSLAMVSCALESGAPNIITVAWLGTVNSDPPMLSVSVRPGRYSYGIIEKSGEFVVNLVSRSLMKAADFCGVRSGRDIDKFAACSLTALPAEGMKNAPCIGESPLYLSCRVRQKLELGSHHLFLADIIAVGAREELLDAKGRLDLSRAQLVAYSHGEYAPLGGPAGFFGYSVARDEVLRRRMPKAKK